MAELRIDGAVITGTIEEIQGLLHELKKGEIPEGYYRSASKGLIKTSDMATAHIANALIKIYRDWVNNLKLADFSNPQELIDKLSEGFVNQPFVSPLFKELWNRRDKKDWKD